MEQLLSYAVRHIKDNIPRLILERAFQPNTVLDLFGDAVHTNLDNAIEVNVLRNSVCRDVQLIASKNEFINLEGLTPRKQPEGGWIINVPLSYTGNREIIGVEAVYFHNHHTQGIDHHNSPLIVNKMAKIVDYYSNNGTAVETSVELIAPNVIYIPMTNYASPPMVAAVNLEVDNILSHVPTHAYLNFGELALQKCQLLIRTILRTKVAEGVITQGVQLGVIRDIIDEFSGSAENYRDLLRQWRRTEVYLDPKRKLKNVLEQLPK